MFTWLIAAYPANFTIHIQTGHIFVQPSKKFIDNVQHLLDPQPSANYGYYEIIVTFMEVIVGFDFDLKSLEICI